MRVLIAPDKLKGSLTAPQAAQAIRGGMSRVFPEADFDMLPIADGGEGTMEVFLSQMPGERITVPVHDPLGRKVAASYAWFPQTRLAVVEMSEASGLWRLHSDEKNPLKANTYGTGELILAAMGRGAKKILVALGGSATNDAGAGAAHALGWKFCDRAGRSLLVTPDSFSTIERLVRPFTSFPCEVMALVDVTNPLLGPNGATKVYGAQKGVTPILQDRLEAELTHLAKLCNRDLGHDYSITPGAGAAGGLGFGLLSFCNATIQPGFHAISALLDLEKKVASSDLIVTAEGSLDAQSENGKGPVEIARMAVRHGKPVVAFAGRVEGDHPCFDACIPIASGPMTLEQSSCRAAELLEMAAQRSARMLALKLKNL